MFLLQYEYYYCLLLLYVLLLSATRYIKRTCHRYILVATPRLYILYVGLSLSHPVGRSRTINIIIASLLYSSTRLYTHVQPVRYLQKMICCGPWCVVRTYYTYTQRFAFLTKSMYNILQCEAMENPQYTRDRSITHSLQSRVPTKSSISRLFFF